MPHDQDENFQQLTRIAKFFVPAFVLITVLVFSWFELSNQLLNISVTSKNIDWSQGCSQGECFGSPTFYIAVEGERFITTEAIYHRVEIGGNYDVETLGFRWVGMSRRIDFLF